MLIYDIVVSICDDVVNIEGGLCVSQIVLLFLPSELGLHGVSGHNSLLLLGSDSPDVSTRLASRGIRAFVFAISRRHWCR